MQRMEIDAPVGKDVWKDILELCTTAGSPR
jgi:hypothetical protein